MANPSFIHLRVRSPYSLLRGAMRIADIMQRCQQYGMPAVAITDRDNLFGSLEFTQAALKNGVQPIVGMTLSLKPMDSEQPVNGRMQPDELLLIAKDETGYANLMALSSESWLNPADDCAPFLTYDRLAERAEGIIALTAGTGGAVGRALLNGRAQEAARQAARLKEIFADRLYIELMRHQLAFEQQIEPGLIQLAMDQHIPLVATNHVHFPDATMFDAHDALMCVAEGRYITESDRPRLTQEHYFKSPQEMQLLFADIPEALANTVAIAQRCAVFAPSRSPILPGFHIEDEAGRVLNESEALRRRAREGLQVRLEQHVFTDAMDAPAREAAATPYRERLEYELDVIITMKFPGYFLIVSDFITWAKQHQIPVGPGRGSGAGSVVAWSLLITDLDPLRFGLIFERFLNPERVSMPDFDIDFCQERRDEVIRYVQHKYGADRVAQIITFGKLQARAVLRDVGRVLQMPYGQVDKICKLVPNNPANPVTLEQAIALEPELKRQMQSDETVDYLVKIALQLEGLYRHASTHAAGVVIADRPLHELVPLYRDPKSDMPVVQYSMKYAEEAGLVKFDFLGLKTLTVLQKTVELLASGHHSSMEPGEGMSGQLDLSRLPFDDAKTYELLSAGHTVGVFQFESAGMQDALRKLKPDRLEDLIALGALYRPGPMDNIPTYIARKHEREQPDYLHPMLKDVLKETYGVIIYQEQVQKIAQIMAGYTLGAADVLRRAMGKKIKSEMDAQREAFVQGATQNGVGAKQASEIFDLVAKFAGYGFNKSHAAAYAVIAYQTAYLKANYPVEFLAASMTYDMHSTDKLNIFRQEAQRFHIPLLPPDINHSSVLFGVEQTPSTHTAGEEALAIRYALAAIKNVGEQAMRAIVDERERSGLFTDMADFARRVDAGVMNRRQLEHLILAGAFDSLHPNRRELFENVDRILGLNQYATRERESSQHSLFGDIESAEPRPITFEPHADWSSLERLQKEFDAIGFYLSAHPLSGYADILHSSGVTAIAALEHKLSHNYNSVKIAGIVTSKKTKISAKGKFAFVQLSDASGMSEISVFDEKLLTSAAALLETGQMVVVTCDGKMEEGGPRLIAQEIKPLADLTPSRGDHQVTLHLSQTGELTPLKQALGEPETRATAIYLRVAIPQHQVLLKLRERYPMNPQKLTALQDLPMVEQVEWK